MEMDSKMHRDTETTTTSVDSDTAVPDLENSDIEQILNDIGGSFSRFQLFNYTLFSIPIAMVGILSMAYVFTALRVEYRCNIPECDLENPVYEKNWTKNVIPTSNLKSSQCQRYQHIKRNMSLQDNDAEFCTKLTLDDFEVVRCDKDGLIYKTDEVSIEREFNLTCDENEWKLAIVGSVSNAASLFFMPLSGIISDRFGRKPVLLFGLSLSSISGLIQSFSINYEMFIIMEFITSSLNSGVYGAAFILSMEWPKAKHRVLVSTVIISMYYIGSGLSSGIAWLTRNFRIYLRFLYVIQLLVGIGMIFGPESLRWVLVSGNKEQLERLLSRASKVNKRELSPSTLLIINRKREKAVVITKQSTNQPITDNNQQSFKALFQSRTLLFRFVICSLSWITVAYVYFGVGIMSVSLNGDKYISFAVTALGGLPSGVFLIYVLKYFGRPKGISISLVITSATILLAKFIPEEFLVTKLILFFTASCFISMAFAAVYVYTTELWPTPLRHSMTGICSTIGRVGSISAPLAPLLGQISESLPILSFGIISLITGTLVLYLPETLNVDMPDTIEEAIKIGTKSSKRKTPRSAF